MQILGIEIRSVDYSTMLELISRGIKSPSAGRVLITYLSAATAYKILKNKRLCDYYNIFNLVHPDGIGMLLAGKILGGVKSDIKRIYGSDFYPRLIERAKREKWSFFFFGDEYSTLNLIKAKIPELIISGVESGFNFNSARVAERIKRLKPDILIVGMGQPLQEKWVFDNLEKLSAKVIICVGEGIKVFAGTKKRGCKLIRKAGLEWLVRLFYEPKRLWRRYLIETPEFLFWSIKEKIRRH